MNLSQYSNVRLLDVFVLGPLQLLISTYVKNKALKYFIFIIGICNIIYNGHNYIYLDLGLMKQPLSILEFSVNKIHGKTQVQRLFNVLIMYPIFMYIYQTTIMPKWVSSAFLLQIILGFIYNLKNFINIL